MGEKGKVAGRSGAWPAMVTTLNAYKQGRMTRQTVQELQSALDELENGGTITTVCSFCNKVRNREGVWVEIPEAVAARIAADETLVSHGFCPACAKENFPEEYEAALRKNKIILS